MFSSVSTLFFESGFLVEPEASPAEETGGSGPGCVSVPSVQGLLRSRQPSYAGLNAKDFVERRVGEKYPMTTHL